MDFNKNMNQDNRGFTLVELIITVVILALVTAPFLSSFVTASNTNVKSKRIQEANELSQYIIEQFKASSVDKLVADYSLTKNYNDPANTILKNYTGVLANTDLPSGYGERYSADITMTPSTSIVNSEVTPVLEEITQKDCAIFADYIYACDSLYSSAMGRKITVTVEYVAGEPKPYQVTLQVYYFDSSFSTIASRTKTVKSEHLPAVYIFYKPFSRAGYSSSMDEINVVNNLAEDELKDKNGNPSKLNTYIISQENFSFAATVSASNISFTESSHPSEARSLFNVLEGFSTLDNTVIYTNISASTVDGSLMKMVKIESLYDLEVVIKYAGDEVSTFTATKNTIG